MSEYVKDEVAILIVTHNNKEAFNLCLDSIVRNTNWKNYRLYILDLGSEKELQEYLQKLFGESKHYFKSYPLDIGLTGVYNKFLGMVNQEYSVFYPCNTLVNENWLSSLIARHNSVENSGCISIKPNSQGLRLESVLEKNNGIGEDKMSTVYMSEKRLIHDFLFFRNDVLEKIGKFDSRDNLHGFEKTEYSFRFLGLGLSNYYLKYHSRFSFRYDNNVLFPPVTDEVKTRLQEQLNTMASKRMYKK